MSVSIVFSAHVAAASLWRYGEDAFVERALQLTPAELATLATRAGARWCDDHGLPLKSRLVVDKVIAFTCIEYFEGALRPLSQERRRPAKAMPDRLRAPGSGLDP